MGDHEDDHRPSNGNLYYIVSWTHKLLLAVFYIGLNEAVSYMARCIWDNNTDMGVCAGIWLICCCVFFGYAYRLGKSQSIDFLVSSIEIVSSKEEVTSGAKVTSTETMEESTKSIEIVSSEEEEEEPTSAATTTETKEKSVDSQLEPDEVDRNDDNVNHGEDKYKVA